MPRVLVAMSGGVDSSVAAVLLKKQGFDVHGAFMQRGRSESGPTADERLQRGCGNERDEADARRVAQHLDIPLDAVAFDEYFEKVINYFVDEYVHGRTPNPCAFCNAKLKFGRLFDHADQIGAEFVATGHYARVTQDDASGETMLRRALRTEKDQSYALFGIRRDRLSRLIFPIGEHYKDQIREWAEEAGLPIFDKPDSQDVCFIPEQDHSAFIHRQRPELDLSGDIITVDGQVVGRHDGIERYTIGQRKGLGVALGEPYFVVRIEADTQRVVIGRRETLARTRLTAARPNWLIQPPTSPFQCEVKIRYRSEPAAARIVPREDGMAFDVEFESPQYGAAPGQVAVCFDGDRVLGGGWIEETSS